MNNMNSSLLPLLSSSSLPLSLPHSHSLSLYPLPHLPDHLTYIQSNYNKLEQLPLPQVENNQVAATIRYLYDSSGNRVYQSGPSIYSPIISSK